VTEPEKIKPETEKPAPQLNEVPEVKLNDTKIRLIGIPFFGIAIPNLTGLFGTITFTDVRYWFGYIFFIGLAGAIWQGNRYLLFRTRKRFTWFDKPIEKLVLLFMNNIFYTTPLTIAWLCSWYNIVRFPIKWDTILIVSLVNVICVLFVTHVYETVFMVKEQQNEQLKNSELQRAKAEAELTALKNQVDPHFMFNSLNTLTHLINTDSKKALKFTEDLAEVYRYILMQKDRTLVLLEDELDFTRKYTDLLHLRFGRALIIEQNFNGTASKNFLIPPTSVFVAFENAVKHNEISEREPMTVTLAIANNQLSITNTLREKKKRTASPGIGLKNLDERFKITIGQSIETGLNGSNFKVSLPMVAVS
jgi:Histidine kinase